jgi:hypothetical protein
MKIYLPTRITPFKGHESNETACIVESYPYGGHRTQKKYWVETNDKHGQRIVTRTLDPKAGRWNKPHMGTYSQVICLYLNNDNNHVEHCHLGVWHTKEELDAFEQAFKDVLTEWQKKTIAGLRVMNIRQDPINYFGLERDEEQAYRDGVQAIAAKIPMPEGCEMPKDGPSTFTDEQKAKRLEIFEARRAERDALVETLKSKGN